MWFLQTTVVPAAVWLAVELVEARTDARRRHQRLIEQRSPRSCAPSRSSGRPAGVLTRTRAHRPMIWRVTP